MTGLWLVLMIVCAIDLVIALVATIGVAVACLWQIGRQKMPLERVPSARVIRGAG